MAALVLSVINDLSIRSAAVPLLSRQLSMLPRVLALATAFVLADLSSRSNECI